MDGIGTDRSAALVQERPVRRRHARAVLEVLHAEGHARQWSRVLAACHRVVDALGVSACEVRVEMDEGVERGIPSVDGRQALVEH